MHTQHYSSYYRYVPERTALFARFPYDGLEYMIVHSLLVSGGVVDPKSLVCKVGLLFQTQLHLLFLPV